MYLVQKLVLILHSCFGKGLYEPSATFNTQHCAQRIVFHSSPLNTSEVVECIYGSAIERFYDEQGKS